MYVEYEEILRNRIFASIFVLIMIFIFAVFLVFVNIKIFSKDLGKIEKILLNFFLVTVIICCTVHFVVFINGLQDDIKNQSYVTYNGEFEISKYNNRYVTIIGEKGEKITLSGRAKHSGGVYNGTVIYAKKSKCLLEYRVP